MVGPLRGAVRRAFPWDRDRRWSAANAPDRDEWPAATSERSAPPTSRSVITKATGTGSTGLGPGPLVARRSGQVLARVRYNAGRLLLFYSAVEVLLGGRALQTSVFDFELPSELIAQEPVEPRDRSRLLVVYRQENRWEHSPVCRFAQTAHKGGCPREKQYPRGAGTSHRIP